MYMTKRIENVRAIRNLRQTEKEPLTPAAPLTKLGSVKMTIAAAQYAGAIATPSGDIPSWRITFLVDAEHLLGTSLTVQTMGATDVVDAQERALIILQDFAQELHEAAKNFDA
jgi:hypothetical protein